MITPDAILAAHEYLCSAVGAGIPAPAKLPLVAAQWGELLCHATDAELRYAVRAHLRTPERGRWWPTVADLVAHMPRVQAVHRAEAQALLDAEVDRQIQAEIDRFEGHLLTEREH